MKTHKMPRKWAIKKTLLKVKKPFWKATKSNNSCEGTKLDDFSVGTTPLTPTPSVGTRETTTHSIEANAVDSKSNNGDTTTTAITTHDIGKMNTGSNTKSPLPQERTFAVEALFTPPVVSGNKYSIGSYSIAKYPIDNISSRRVSLGKSFIDKASNFESSTTAMSVASSIDKASNSKSSTTVKSVTSSLIPSDYSDAKQTCSIHPILRKQPLTKKIRKTSKSSSSSSHRVKFARTEEDAMKDFERLPNDNKKALTAFIAMCSGAAMMPRKVFVPQLLSKSRVIPDAFKQTGAGGVDDINFTKMAIVFHILMCLPEDAFPTCTKSSRRSYARTIGGHRDLIAYGRKGMVTGDSTRTRSLRKIYKRVSSVNLLEARAVFAKKMPEVVTARDTTKAVTTHRSYEPKMILFWLAVPFWLISAIFVAAVVIGFFMEAANSFKPEEESIFDGMIQNDMEQCANLLSPDLEWILPT